MSDTRYFQNTEDVAERRIRDEVVLLPISSKVGGLGRMYDLNPTATIVWDMAKSGTHTDAVVDRLVEEFEVDREQATADVSRVIATLTEVGALVTAAPTSPP